MTEPSSLLTVLGLATRIAKEAGTAYRGTNGTDRAMPPVNKDDLEDIKQVINDGIRQFESDAPTSGWQWRRRILQVNISGLEITGIVDSVTDPALPSTPTLVDLALASVYDTNDDLNGYWIYILTGTGQYSYAQITDYVAVTGTITVVDWLDANGNTGGVHPAASSTYIITRYETVGGDIARYPLPENFGGEINGPIGYYKDANHSQFIGWTSEAIIRNQQQASGGTGYPYLAAIRSLEPTSSSLGPKRRYELALYPDPVQVDILEFPYILVFNGVDFETGVATGGSTLTVADTSRDEPDNYFNGWRIDIIGGTGRGAYAIVTDYTGSTGVFTVADWLGGPSDPTVDSVYFVQPANNLHPAGVKFDEVVKAACLAEGEQYFEGKAPSGAFSGAIERYVQKALPKAYEADTRSLMFTKVGKQPRQLRTWSIVEKDNE
jgi:hypothetical protein